MNAPVLDQSFRPPTPAELAALVEDVVLTIDSAFWPALAIIEDIDLAVERLPLARRRAIRAQLDRDRQDLLFDRTKIAAVISIEVERRLIAEAVIRGDRS